jgi:hypothetical protein
VFRLCRGGQRVTGDRDIKKSISASFRGVLLVVDGVHVCAVLQQNLAKTDEVDKIGPFEMDVKSGNVKGCTAAADSVTNTRQKKNSQPQHCNSMTSAGADYLLSLAWTSIGSTVR